MNTFGNKTKEYFCAKGHLLQSMDDLPCEDGFTYGCDGCGAHDIGDLKCFSYSFLHCDICQVDFCQNCKPQSWSMCESTCSVCNKMKSAFESQRISRRNYILESRNRSFRRKIKKYKTLRLKRSNQIHEKKDNEMLHG